MSIPANATGTFAEVPIESVDPLISILVGEIIYNLRAALDYIVYELAHSDSGKYQEGTQFLICDCEKDFRAWREKRLCGISPQGVTMIEALQPYKGCQWTRLVRDLSNPDKHRHLVKVRRVAKVGTPITQTASHHDSIAQFVAFEDKTPLIDTLEDLRAEVARTVGSFKRLIK